MNPPMPRVIFVDGLPGCGKSTTAQRISLHLRKHGYAARWVFEHEKDHPIYTEDATRALREQRADADPDLLTRGVDHYRNLARQLTENSDETIIFEGTLFQAAVGTQLLLDAPTAAINAVFDDTLAALAPHDIALVYFRPEDPVAAVEHTARERGEWFTDFVVSHFAATPLGQKEQINSWPQALSCFARQQRQCNALVSRFTGESLILNPQAGDWDQRNLEITEFLKLPPMDAPPADPAWSQHVGRYRAEGAEDVWEFILNEQGLALAGPPVTPLWPRPEGGFELDGVAIEMAFESNGDAPSHAVRCAPRIADLPPRLHRI